MLPRNGDDEQILYTPQETRVGADVELRKAYSGKRFALYGFIVVGRWPARMGE